MCASNRRDVIKGAALTATGMVLGAMALLKSQEETAQKPVQPSVTQQPNSKLPLAGKVADITGAARGIRRAIAVTA